MAKGKKEIAVPKSDSPKKDDNISTSMHKKAMLAALKASLGVVTEACDACGIARQTHYRWLGEDPEYARSVNDIDDVALDSAESSLHKQIKEGNPTSTIFYLKTKGKKRGYIERTEHIVETTENLATRIDYEQAKNLLTTAGIETTTPNSDLASDE
jgi:hypothetical protein